MACGPIIAHVSPQPAGLGLAAAGSEDRNRCVVGVNLGCRHDMLPDLIDQRREQLAGRADPTGQRRAIEVDAFTSKDLGLAIKWQMVAEFRYQHMSQQIGARQTALDRPCRSRRFYNPLATRACELRPHVANHLVGSRNAFQLLRYIFAELAQRAAAIRAAVVRWKMSDDFAWKVFRKRLACRTSAGLCRSQSRARLRSFLRILDSFICRLCSLQFFESKLKLLELSCELLALLAEDHPPVLLNDKLQMFDLMRVGPEVLMLRNYQLLQCFDIERIKVRQWSR